MENFSVLDAPLPAAHNHTRRRRASFTQQPAIAPVQTPSAPRSRHQHSRSQQLPSTSPAFGGFLFGHQHSLSLGTSSGSTSPLTEPTTPLLSPRFFEDSAALSVEFDANPHQLVVRPNSTVRGRVILQTSERLYLTRVRIKFWAEEVATVKINENGSGERIHQAITTFFQVDQAVFGVETTAHPYMQASFEELDAGRHEFPFSLRFPNVNYPPSIDDPPGFSIRFIWTAHVDGAGGQPGFSSKRYVTPYRPLIGSPPDKEWVYRTTLNHDKKAHPLVQLQAKLKKQAYCPDDPFSMHLTMTPLSSDIKITAVSYKFRKHHLGRISTAQGLATRKAIRDLYQTSIEPHQSTIISFNIPTRNVSPTFQSNHIQVYYDLLLQVTLEECHFLRNSVSKYEFSIPVHISNLAHDEIRQIPGLLMIQHYANSKLCPEFLDVSVDLAGEDQPPSYYSSACNGKQDRQEKTVYFVRSPNGYSHAMIPYYDYSLSDLGEAHIVPDTFE